MYHTSYLCEIPTASDVHQLITLTGSQHSWYFPYILTVSCVELCLINPVIPIRVDRCDGQAYEHSGHIIQGHLIPPLAAYICVPDT